MRPYGIVTQEDMLPGDQPRARRIENLAQPSHQANFSRLVVKTFLPMVLDAALVAAPGGGHHEMTSAEAQPFRVRPEPP